MYRRGSHLSEASFMEDVEMAHDEVFELGPMPLFPSSSRTRPPRREPGQQLTPTIQVFSGPMSESIPTSVSAFSHRRRQRADSSASLTSFAYYDEDQDSQDGLEDHAIAEDGESEYGGYTVAELEDLEAGLSSESTSPTPSRRKSSGSRKSVDRPLLRRHSSTGSTGSGADWRGRRSNQKIYIMTEDLTIVIAGFTTSPIGYAVYALLCIATLGIGWLLFRWLPRWRVKLVGRNTPIKECDWIVIENQWGEFAVQDVSRQTYGRSLSTVFGDDEKGRHGEWDEDEDPLIQELRCLDYRYIRFVYHPIKDKFVLANTWKDPAWTEVSTLREGLDNDERDYRELVFGKNLIDIAEKTIGQLLVDEVFHPFYVFQIASLLLWSLDEYYYYACAIFIISAVSIITTLIETKTSMKRLREVSKFECEVRVLRSGFWTHVDSAELVPGDVYEVTDPALNQFPCDSLLLSGDCIVNESMLTGESIPVSKLPVSNASLDMLDLSASAVHPEIARHMLFSGTKIIRARRPHEDHVDDEAAALAMVVRTGFNTTKGALVRSMLFPKPSGFKFYRDSFRYISVMAIIAMIGFVASFINFVHLGLEWHLIVVRALDLITIVVPPALPATLTIGTSFALSRLKQKQIFCISPQRVNVGGKLDVVCFDKTGTLTEEGLDVLGVRVVERPRNRFSELLADPYDILPGSQHDRDPTVEYLAHKTILYTMATCHSLRKIDEELLGDPLDVKMFDFTGWSYEEGEQKSGNPGDDDPEQKLSPSVARPPPGREYDVDDHEDDPNRKPVELGVLKAFEFVSQLRRASVIVRQFGSKSGQVYVKGAPEVMKEICRAESFPTDYEELLAFYTHRGFRVIACATKTIAKLNWLKVQKMKREEAESQLDFVGFIIFENKLKPSTAPVIEELERANIRKTMCTGDNILTAISVARECGLINKTAHCFVPHFVEGDCRTALSKLSWESVDDPVFKLDENTLKPLPPPPEADVSLPYDISNLRNYSLAVSGDVFRWVVDFASESVLREMLVCGQVFARMSPDEKHELVEKLQSIDYCVGFCGDGANDCGALKAADVGISLSEAEASVAAPFTSRNFDISCVPQVIKEGRAALVTSFSCFKYMSLYSAIQFCSVSFLYASASNLGDFQFLFIDLLLILPIAIFMGWSGAYPILSRKRPTANLVSRKVLTPLLGQMVFCILVQFIAFHFVQKQDWYMPPVVDKDHSNSLNSQNTALFLVSCFQYILSAVVLSVGKPYREPMSRNLPFITTIFFTLAISAYMLFDPAQWVMDWMELTYMDVSFKVFIMALGLGNFALAYVSERYLFPGLSKWIGVAKVKFGGAKWQKKKKEYKIIAESMRM
ncbi:P-type ATPase-like protein [Cucurbitaria berberidis CBS 394.84]|uniref:Cation-transporting ATPase n=1 Tax=Cucurbitaria berberidis CBS 394.84 TaxID=1168544 RepID=A0A9P4LDB4_9PLEO|nr:P-type ATPase-like protein [Cucurbitaria berberidis CBS 394.84]KAF1850865.1 P-type ATPase-like protein [Cucurbitaria berberidis CBS 394.84]